MINISKKAKKTFFSHPLMDNNITKKDVDHVIKFLKGNNRPINNYKDRIELFAIVPFIDYIYLYQENLENDNEMELDKIMNIIDPDIWTKGSDYTIEKILKLHPNLKNIKIIDIIEGKSTTNIINKISDSNKT